MITSQNRPGLPDFSRVTLKNMGRPGDEAIWSRILYTLDAIDFPKAHARIGCSTTHAQMITTAF